MTTRTIPYRIVWPGGNTTAIVSEGAFGIDRKSVAQAIMKNDPKIEQVGFLSKRPRSLPRLTMMGGEFSGNGVRSAAYILGRERSKRRATRREMTFLMRSSGVRQPVRVSLRGQRVMVALRLSASRTRTLGPQRALVTLPGISHFILPSGIVSPAGRERVVGSLLRHPFVRTASAIGIMFIRAATSRSAVLDPYVWVRSTRSLVRETSCGSGSIALAISLMVERGKSRIRLNVVQPSGESLVVVIRRAGTAMNVFLSGRVKYLGEGSVTLTRHPPIR